MSASTLFYALDILTSQSEVHSAHARAFVIMHKCVIFALSRIFFIFDFLPVYSTNQVFTCNVLGPSNLAAIRADFIIAKYAPVLVSFSQLWHTFENKASIYNTTVNNFQHLHVIQRLIVLDNIIQTFYIESIKELAFCRIARILRITGVCCKQKQKCPEKVIDHI